MIDGYCVYNVKAKFEVMLPFLNTEADASTLSNRRPTQPRRRPYTASELASAVRAICLGQLGTRRAASVYGIPRSTLRNKICKLNEIRKHEEAVRGGTPISLSDFVRQFASAEKITHGTSSRREGDDVRCSSAVALLNRVASVFKV